MPCRKEMPALDALEGKLGGPGFQVVAISIDTRDPEKARNWLKEVGIGLRFGSSRSSFGNVIHVDLAFPLDGDDSIDSVQFLVETKASF